MLVTLLDSRFYVSVARFIFRALGLGLVRARFGVGLRAIEVLWGILEWVGFCFLGH